MTDKSSPYDCIIIGAGPGGLQAAIHLGRYNRRVLLADRGGGRTAHAKHMVNYLGLPEVSGLDLITIGLEQVQRFGVQVVHETITRVEKNGHFFVHSSENSYRARFVIVSAGAVDHLPRVKNLGRFFGHSFFTCVDCDGHHTTGKKLLVMGNSINAARLALGMKQMYTNDISLLLTDYVLPADYEEAIREEGIALHSGEAVVLQGDADLEGVGLTDGRSLPCEVIMASYGWHLNDDFLQGLSLGRDNDNFKVLTNNSNESSVSGLYVLGAMKQGHSQAIIAAGQGAVAAIDINLQLLEI